MFLFVFFAVFGTFLVLFPRWDEFYGLDGTSVEGGVLGEAVARRDNSMDSTYAYRQSNTHQRQTVKFLFHHAEIVFLVVIFESSSAFEMGV